MAANTEVDNDEITHPLFCDGLPTDFQTNVALKMIAHIDDSTSHDDSDGDDQAVSPSSSCGQALAPTVDHMPSTGVLMQRNGKLPFQSPGNARIGCGSHRRMRARWWAKADAPSRRHRLTFNPISHSVSTALPNLAGPSTHQSIQVLELLPFARRLRAEVLNSTKLSTRALAMASATADTVQFHAVIFDSSGNSIHAETWTIGYTQGTGSRKHSAVHAQSVFDDEQERSANDDVKGICDKAAALSSLSMNLSECVQWEETEASSLALPWSCVAGEHNTAMFFTHSPMHSGAKADTDESEECFVVVRATSNAPVLAVDSEEGGAQQADWSRVHLELQKNTAGAVSTPPTASALCGMLREGTLVGMDPV